MARYETAYVARQGRRKSTISGVALVALAMCGLLGFYAEGRSLQLSRPFEHEAHELFGNENTWVFCTHDFRGTACDPCPFGDDGPHVQPHVGEVMLRPYQLGFAYAPTRDPQISVSVKDDALCFEGTTSSELPCWHVFNGRSTMITGLDSGIQLSPTEDFEVCLLASLETSKARFVIEVASLRIMPDWALSGIRVEYWSQAVDVHCLSESQLAKRASCRGEDSESGAVPYRFQYDASTANLSLLINERLVGECGIYHPAETGKFELAMYVESEASLADTVNCRIEEIHIGWDGS